MLIDIASKQELVVMSFSSLVLELDSRVSCGGEGGVGGGIWFRDYVILHSWL